MICIYCSRDLDIEDFTTEHVVPEAFGTFEQNLTLNGLVCGSCNQCFGDTIDFALARGSIEALQRLGYGIKPTERAHELRSNRVRFVWKGTGPWDGAILRLSADADGLTAELVPQVGFERASGEGFVYVSEETLRDVDQDLPNEINSKKGLFLVANSREIEHRLVQLLETRGIQFRESHRISPPMEPGEQVPVEITTTVDALVLRCVAKIAFNYLASTQSREFVLQDDFDIARRFIRYAERPPYPIAIIDFEPILRDDAMRRRQTNGHLVTVSWADDRVSILAQVSLFNHARYRVSLARHFRGIWRQIRSGHHFDIERRKVGPLLGTSLVVP